MCKWSNWTVIFLYVVKLHVLPTTYYVISLHYLTNKCYSSVTVCYMKHLGILKNSVMWCKLLILLYFFTKLDTTTRREQLPRNNRKLSMLRAKLWNQLRKKPNKHWKKCKPYLQSRKLVKCFGLRNFSGSSVLKTT